MPINLQTLGLKLSRYRDQLAQSLEDVAASTAIDVQRLRAIEQGESEPTGDEILILADHFRCDFRFFISNERTAPFEETETLFRAHGNAFSKEDRAAVQEFLYLCETEEFLMNELGRTTTPFDFPPVGNHYQSQGAAAAAKFRERMGHSSIQVPRDIYSEFRSVGVHVFRRKLGNSAISGLFIMHPTAGKCALINYSEDVYRQRFSAAHEMAHAIFDSQARASLSLKGQRDNLEHRANRFASCYLMPPEFLRQLPGPPPSAWTETDAQHWANELRVSCDALGVALKKAQLVDEAGCERIRSFRVPREAKIDPEIPQTLSEAQRARKAALLELGLSDFYVRLCFDAFGQEKISLGRLAEALLCSRGQLAELARLYGGNLHGH